MHILPLILDFEKSTEYRIELVTTRPAFILHLCLDRWCQVDFVSKNGGFPIGVLLWHGLLVAHKVSRADYIPIGGFPCQGVPLKSPGNPIDPLILTPMMTGVPDCQNPGQTLLGVQVGIWKGVKFDFIWKKYRVWTVRFELVMSFQTTFLLLKCKVRIFLQISRNLA